ncbi:glycerol dehydratase reactivase beta/small subunit family protein [Limosilactobacillus sp.]|jgi:hypothetical protein|uniref:glycerol dehydratase reactivase beta/small subunit family protein n=1 Tax=Limosilactobacillus sp. TaxID=2773925 RepID=UPI0035A0F02E
MADNSEKPTIVIGLDSKNPSASVKLKPLLNGIEEEQIPVSTRSISVDDVVSRAYQAALSSRLDVGIAYDGNRYIVHYKNLPEKKPLFDFNIDDNVNLRILGANAARLVKGIPFKKLQ